MGFELCANKLLMHERLIIMLRESKMCKALHSSAVTHVLITAADKHFNSVLNDHHHAGEPHCVVLSRLLQTVRWWNKKLQTSCGS